MENVNIRQLLTEAFGMAKLAKGHDWRRMTIAVLKNRLLRITKNSFREFDYGVPNMIEFVKQYPDLMSLDLSARPPIVEWKISDESTIENTTIMTTQKIRSDLWNAILDYSSGDEYEWDPSENIANRVSVANPERKLPTIDKAVMAEWRNKFAALHRSNFTSDDQANLERLNKWATDVLANAYIPRQLHGPWNGFLKDEVASRLKDWFTKNGFSETPIIELKQKETPKQTRDSLRDLLHRCIDEMSIEELSDLRITAGVILRVTRHAG